MIDTPTPHPMDTALKDGTEIVLHTPGAFCSYAVARWVPFKDGTGGAWLTDRNVACSSCGEPNTTEVPEPAGWLTIGEALSAAPADDDVERVARALRKSMFPNDNPFDDISPSVQEEYRVIACAAIAAMPSQSPPPIMGEGRSIMLEMAAADGAQQMWERRWEALKQMYARERCFVDQDGNWGLRDFLDYVGQICGFEALATPSTQEKHHGR